MGNEGAAAGLGVRTGLRPRRRLVLAVEFSMVMLSCEILVLVQVVSTVRKLRLATLGST